MGSRYSFNARTGTHNSRHFIALNPGLPHSFFRSHGKKEMREQTGCVAENFSMAAKKNCMEGLDSKARHFIVARAHK